MTSPEILAGRVVATQSPALAGLRLEPSSWDRLRAVIAEQGELVAKIRRERDEGGAS